MTTVSFDHRTFDHGLLTTSRFCDIWPQWHLTTWHLTASDIWPQVTFDRGTFDRKWHLTVGHLTAVAFDHCDIWPRDIWPQVTFDHGTFDHKWHLTAGFFDRQPRLKSHYFLSNHASIDKVFFFFFLQSMREWMNFVSFKSIPHCPIWQFHQFLLVYYVKNWWFLIKRSYSKQMWLQH